MIKKMRQSIFIILDLKGKTKNEILFNIASFAERQGLIQDKRMLYRKFLEREGQGTTAIGNEIALPEACWIEMCCPYAFILCRTENSVRFNSLDGKPIRIVLASLGRNKNDLSRLKPLLHLVRLLKSPAARNALIRANSEIQVFNLLNCPKH